MNQIDSWNQNCESNSELSKTLHPYFLNFFFKFDLFSYLIKESANKSQSFTNQTGRAVRFSFLLN